MNQSTFVPTSRHQVIEGTEHEVSLSTWYDSDRQTLLSDIKILIDGGRIELSIKATYSVIDEYLYLLQSEIPHRVYRLCDRWLEEDHHPFCRNQ